MQSKHQDDDDSMPVTNAIPRENVWRTFARLGRIVINPPKRRLWKAEPTFQHAFPGEALFSVLVAQIRYSHP
jgi:hypothetical protein